MTNLSTKYQSWRKLIFILLVLCLAAILTLTSCITVNPPASSPSTEQPPAQAPVPALPPAPVLSPTPTPTPTAAPTPITTPTPTTLPSPTPTSNEQVPLPSIEAFVADPSYNPGGSRLSGLSDAKIAVDTAWQRLSDQSYYYTVPALTDRYKPYDTTQLQKVLDELKKTPWASLYKANYFDCTEMSTLLQRELAIRGFESWIVIGKDPNVRTGHAWLVVFLRSPSSRLVPVEATALRIPQLGQTTRFSNGVVQTYEDYTRQGWVLQDIYQAISWWSTGEFDWWNRTDILQKLSLPTIVTTPTPAPVPSPKPTQYVLSTSVSPLGAGTVSPSSGTYDSGTSITLTATPSSGYRFSSWSGDANGTSPTITITMDTNKNVMAIFTSIPTPAPAPAPVPAPSQHIEATMKGVSILQISYMNYTNYLQAGDVIDGVVQLTGPSRDTDNSYQWTFQILGPGGESIKVLTGDFRTTTSMSFHTVASYAGTYRIRITHQSISTKTLTIDLTPPGWGYANLG